MRKVKTLEILAAAVVAVPGIALAAGEVEGYTPAVVNWQPMVQQPDMTGIGQGGKFQVAPSIGGLFGGGGEADVDATWVDFGASFSWHEGANWSTNPAVPDGPNAIARFGPQSRGPVPDLGGTTIQLQRLDLNDPQLTTIVNGAINLTGTGTVDAQGSNFDLPSVIFTFSNQAFPGNILGGPGAANLNIGGSAGFNKTGDTHVTLNNNNNFTGPVNISGGGKIITTVGDGAFGNASNPITLNNGSIQISTANMTTNRVITAGPGGGQIYYVGAGRTFVMNGGDVAGSGTMLFNGAFGASVTTAGSINVNTSHTGTLHIGGGTLNLGGAAGAFLNSSAIKNEGALILHAGNNNRVGNAPMSFHGSQLTVFNQETIGPVTFDGSTQLIQVGGGASLAMGNLTRNNQSTARFLGLNLGTGGSTITFASAPTLVGGLIPWAYGSPGDISGTNPESQTNTVVTYGPNGVTPVTALESNQANWGAGTNALVSDAGANIVGSVNVNSLVLRVTDFYQADPMTVSGNGTINITSGVILSGNAGFTAGGALNSAPGNIVNANLNAGANPYYIHTPSAVTFNGVMAGTGGLVKAGGRTAHFNGLSTYTGQTQLTGFVRYTGNVLSGQPGPFGADTSPIVLYGGNIVPRNLADGAANGTMTAILAVDDPQAGPSTFSRPISVPYGTALIRNFSDSANGTMTISGNITLGAEATIDFEAFDPAATGNFNSNSFVLSGTISGAGNVEYSAAGTAVTDATITGANTYTGGTVVQASDLRVGVNSVGSPGAVTSGPFGTGSIQMWGNTNFLAHGGPRTVMNPLFQYTGVLGLGDQMTIASPIQNVSGDNVVEVTTGTGTISGNIGFGGGYFKQGAGTLVLTGNNTFSGVLNVGNGTIAGGMLVLASPNAIGDQNGGVGVNQGENAIGLRGGHVFPAETAILRGDGIGNMGALRNLQGNNTWSGNVLAGLPNTIGVDQDTLNVGGLWFSIGGGTLAGTAMATKVGPGTLQIGSGTVTSGTASFQGAVVADGLTVAGGTLRIQPSVGGVKRVSDVGTVQLAGGPGAPSARLDLTDNALVVDYASGGPSPLLDVRGYILSGYAGGAWTGNGITTSMGDANSFGLGYAENNGTASGTNFTTFLGDPVDNTAILVRHTRYGDANLDGTVSLADFNRLAANFGTPAGAVWGQGDFNYDGVINLADFNRLAANFGLAAAGPDVTPDDWAALAAAVPEPSSLGLVALAGIGLLKRRRRSR